MDVSAEKGITTLDRINQIAFIHLLEKGYEGTNLRKISDEIGIKAASLYFYYKSKKDMFMAIYASILEGQLTLMREIIDLNKDLSYQEQLFLIFRSGIKSCINNCVIHKFIMRYRVFAPSEVVTEAREIYKSYQTEEFELLSPLMQQCISQSVSYTDRDLDFLYHNFRQLQDNVIYEMILSGLVIKDEAIQLQFENFLKCRLIKIE